MDRKRAARRHVLFYYISLQLRLRMNSSAGDSVIIADPNRDFSCQFFYMISIHLHPRDEAQNLNNNSYSLYSFEIKRDVTSGRLHTSLRVTRDTLAPQR